MERWDERQSTDYDAWADIYDAWAGTAPAAQQNLPFYVDAYTKTPGVVVELGIGNGRIAIEAARQGKPIVGVDSSSEMLKLCATRAREAAVLDRLTLIQADFRDFQLPEPAQLIAIPFHSIGHLVRLDDKRAGLRHILEQLEPGGRLIFDHFVFDHKAAQARHGVVSLRNEYVHPVMGHDVLLWVTARYHVETQSIRIITWTDELDEDGVVFRRTYRRLSFSWIEPDQMRDLLEGAGFEIESLYGSFDRLPFTRDSQEQIWVCRKPAR